MNRIRLASLAAAIALVAAAPVLAGPLLGGGEKPRATAPGAPDAPPPGPPEGAGFPRGPKGPGGPGFGFGGGPILDHAIGELRGAVRFWDDSDLVAEMGLTADQTAALQESYDQTVAAIESLEGAVRESYKALHETVEVDEPNISEVNAAIDAATNAQNEAMKIALGHRVVVKNTLTEEQEEILRSSRREHLAQRFPGVRERTEGPEGPRGPGMRERMHGQIEQAGEVREKVRSLMQDGSLSEEDWATIDAELNRAADERIQQVRERIRQLEQELDGGEMPAPRGPRPDGAAPRGPRGNNG